MKPITGFILFFLACLPLAELAAFDPQTSLVEIEVTKKDYDYRMPWISRNEQVRKNGILIGEKQILTTADGLSDQYLCRVRKGGESRQYTAELVWVDFYANVAILDVSEPGFWEGMQAVALAQGIPQSGKLQIYRWRGGRIEERAAEIIRLSSGSSKMSYLRHLVLTVSSTIESAGWAEVVFDGEELVGLTASSAKDRLNILPIEFIMKVIERHSIEEGSGLGYFDFKTMSAKNPALPASKGLDRRDVGVVVTEVGGKGLAEGGLIIGDIILEVDGFEIDSAGKYVDPEYGRLGMSSLATRSHGAGESMPFKVWRAGKLQVIDYTLPPVDFEKDFIPDHRYNQAPQYLMAGGLVFQPLDGPLLRVLGKNKPVLLDYYSQQKGMDDRSGLVVLSGVLPDDYNLGYEDIRYALVDQINGRMIGEIKDVEAALQESEGGFHRIRFMPEEGVRQIVLDAGALDRATARILQNYRIPSASQLGVGE
ncbi:MAG: PDZ domain-containing protein [Opitutales bacterium]